MTAHGTTAYRNGCRYPICTVAKKHADYNYWNRMDTKCIIPDCGKAQATAFKRGLCMGCYSKAKKLIEQGKTTWAKLVDMQLALASDADDPFMKAFNDAATATN